MFVSIELCLGALCACARDKIRRVFVLVDVGVCVERCTGARRIVVRFARGSVTGGHMSHVVMSCRMSALCGKSVRDGVSHVCSSDDGRNSVHGRMCACWVCSELTCREFEANPST